MRTGIQISSLKPLLTTPEQVRRAFARVRALGCRTVQLQWVHPSVPAAAIARALADNDLRSVSVQDLYTAVRADLDYYVNLNAATGGTWLCVSRVPEDCRSRAGLEAFTRELADLARRLEDRGQRLCFHPVAADFAPAEGLVPADRVLEALPELEVCLDLYHVSRAGRSLPAELRRLAGRVPMVHFKDGRGSTLVPAGQGDVDWTGVAAACLETGVGWGFVEQEQWQGDPYDCLGAALDWLRGQMTLEGRP